MSLNLYKYSNLIKKNTEYARKMRILANQIFVEPNSDQKLRPKVMKIADICAREPNYKKPFFVNYYPRHAELGHLFNHLRNYGLYRDEHADFVDEYRRLRELRGKCYEPYGRKQARKSKTLLDTVPS